MRALVACVFPVILAGCVTLPFGSSPLIARGGNVRVLEIPNSPAHNLQGASTVIGNRADFEAFLNSSNTVLSSAERATLARQVEVDRLDFSKQALVMVRHDASSGSTFRFSAYIGRAQTLTPTLICDVRTRRVGTCRMMANYWFAVVVDKDAIAAVEIRFDGQHEQSFLVPSQK